MAKREIIWITLPLIIFAVLGTLLVGTTHYLTKDSIEKNESEALLKSLNELLPIHAYDNNILNNSYTYPGKPFESPYPVVVYPALTNGKPEAALFRLSAADGYNGPIRILVGIDYDTERLLGVRILQHRETPGLGDKIELARSDWVLKFFDRSLINPTPEKWYVKKDGGEFDQFTGATITPRAVVGAVRRCLIYFSEHKEELFIKTSKIIE